MCIRDRIGAKRSQEIELDWMPGTNCVGPTFDFVGLSEGGVSLKIPIGEDEYIWMEYRSDSGYDSHLPGNGILVMQQDLSIGDLEDNLVNSHPEMAWLKIIEADGEQNLVAGNNDGEQSDLFWDEDLLGSEGITIRNRDGILVDWTANISVEQGLPTVTFSSPECGHETEVDLPDYGSVLLPSDNIPIIADCSGINYDLTSTDGRDLVIDDDEIKFTSEGIIGVIGNIVGTINCDTGTPVDVKHSFEIVGNIPLETEYESSIPTDEKSIVKIPIDLKGDGEQVWLVGVNGPLSRIATTEDNKKLSLGSTINLEIDPAGLLVDGMDINGEIILASDSGQKYTVKVKLVSGEDDKTRFQRWTEPAILVPMALALSALWVILGIDSSSRQVAADEQEVPIIPEQSNDPSFVDPFGQSYR